MKAEIAHLASLASDHLALARHPLEPVRIARLQAGDVDDLVRVSLEMAQAFEDRRQDRLVEALNLPAIGSC